MSPPISASRVAVLPWMLVLSVTLAPAASRARSVIWPSTSCSSKSFEPTARSTSASDSASIDPAVTSTDSSCAPRPHPARVNGSAIAALIAMAREPVQFFIWNPSLSRRIIELPDASRREQTFDDAAQPVEQKRQRGNEQRSGEDHDRSVELDADEHLVTESAGPQEVADGHRADREHERGAGSGGDHRDGERKLDADQDAPRGHPHAASCVEHTLVHLLDADDGVP